MSHPDGEDATPTAGPAQPRMVKPGTSEFARDALRKSEARENHLLEVAIDALEDRASSAEASLAAERRERRIERIAWAAFVLVMVALFIGRELSLSYGGVDVSTRATPTPPGSL